MERLFAIALMGVSGAVFFMAQSFPKSIFSPVHPGTFPSIVSASLFACSLLLLVKTIREPAAETAENGDAAEGSRHGGLLTGLLLIALLIGMAAAFELVGFVIACGIAAIILAYVESRKPVASVIAGACIVTIVYFLFRSVLGVPLP